MISMWKSHGKPILVLLLGASLGRAMETWSDAEVEDYATTVVRDIFGAESPAPKQVSRTAWSSDPFAHGSYACIGVDASPRDLDTLAEPVGDRMFFAGEATNSYHWAACTAATNRVCARRPGSPTTRRSIARRARKLHADNAATSTG
ncbi:FAD-dependent oxidoreductase [Nocardia sp. CA-128927]|uniref:FAD-dependent oxidoreductase n=1 Tax=Nocardia sp. CA-128927 TaxID=3239975 RepID=UPI003D96B27A